MTTAAEGSITLAEQDLANTLADCHAFQAWAGVASQAAALERIYFDGLPAPDNGRETYTADELAALRPYAVIWTDEEEGFRRKQVAAGAGFYFEDSGRLHLELVQEIAAADQADLSASDRKFKNALGLILDELAELAGQGGYLTATSFATKGPLRPHPDSEDGEGPWQWAKLVIDWGLTG